MVKMVKIRPSTEGINTTHPSYNILTPHLQNPLPSLVLTFPGEEEAGMVEEEVPEVITLRR